MLRPMTAVLLSASLLLTACAGSSGTPDPYADPAGTAPVPLTAAETTATFSATVSGTPDAQGLLTVNVPGFVDASGNVVKNLGKSNFTVIEDGKLKGFTAAAATTSSSIPTDIVFVFDTTGSMASQIRGVASSIVAFSKTLETSGLDVHLGAVTFGDAFDTVDAPTSVTGGVALGRPGIPPGFDTDERPTLPLTDDFDAFRTFIGSNTARDGQDSAENAPGALNFAYGSMAWRPGAARVLIVITDVYQHQAGALGAIPVSSRWAPPSMTALLTTLKGRATVHVIGPDMSGYDITPYADMKDLTGPAGTCGVFIDLATGLTSTALSNRGRATPTLSTLDLDLTKLPIQTVLANAYTIRYRGTKTGGTHTLRLRIESGGIRGETTVTTTY